MDFCGITSEDLLDTGSLSSAIFEADLRECQSLAPLSIIEEGSAPNFQTMFANEQLENPKSTLELKL